MGRNFQLISTIIVNRNIEEYKSRAENYSFRVNTIKSTTMKSNSFLLRIPGVSTVVKIISLVWDTLSKDNSSESELTARVRYSVAEKIGNEM
jgi:hypothetical protein